MEKKRSKGIKIFGWIEVIFGICGLVLFLLGAFLYIHGSLHLNATGIDFKNAVVNTQIGFVGIITSLPILAMLPLGIGILKLKPLARKLSIILLPLATLAGCLIFIVAWDWLSFLLILPLILLVSFQVYFFTRPKVKEQFR